jgi:hypothetical protein
VRALYGFARRSNSGNFAMLAAIRRASSRVSKLAAVRRPGSSSTYASASSGKCKSDEARVVITSISGGGLHAAAENT